MHFRNGRCISMLTLAVWGFSPIVVLAGDAPKNTADRFSPGDEIPRSVVGLPQPQKMDAAQLESVATGLRRAPIYSYAIKSVRFFRRGQHVRAGLGNGVVWEVSSDPRRSSSRFLAHDNWTFDIDVSSDGEWVATGGGDNLIRIWPANREDRRSLVLSGHTDDVHGVAFTPDGTQLVSGADDTMVLLWDLSTEQARLLGRHDKQVTCVAVSPDGKIVASSSRDGTIKLWNIADLSLIRTLQDHTADVLNIAFSPDGHQLASASYDQTIRVWNVVQEEPPKTIGQHESWAFAVKFSRDGKGLFSGGGDHTLRVWDLVGGRKPAVFSLGSDVSSIDVNDEGRLVAASTAAGEVHFFAFDAGKLSELSVARQPDVFTAVRPGNPPESIAGLQHYLKLQHDSEDPKGKAWFNAVAELGAMGDEFTLQQYSKIDRESLTVAQRETLDRSIERIQERIRNAKTSQDLSGIGLRLRRAALADLNCDICEHLLVPATLEAIREEAKDENVRRGLQHLLTSIRTADAVEPTNEELKMEQAVQQRVKDYIQRIVTPNGELKAKTQ